ncbi:MULTISPECIES: antitoxin MazE family protein [Rhodopseudomonas]|uniref:DUF3018 family protein n=1 Tax=Rhodopseudomonas palustris TaxID=1076 RepID=A0A0D7ET85_RHOPL|nr:MULTISPECIES: antitoxin MazE family protein [Rhodopseudomonas]KIZ44003.1 hypothetical protein OO17_10475 [Rhodopseudomonas palustris]MDF3810344.1 antitoxin MazE family protein [Rhodopseudomonas sp. BAL398]WOK17177.1 antitoxin MazE family protein [Rhodopseudomonas sp. BAL398]
MAKAADKVVKRSSATGRGESAGRVRKHREKMKAMGLKPVTLWVPDVNSPEFRAQVARDIAAINASADEKVILEELSHIEIDGWK